MSIDKVFLAPDRGASFWEKFPNGGGGVGKIFFKKVPISIWELRKSKGGVSIFKKLEFQGPTGPLF